VQQKMVCNENPNIVVQQGTAADKSSKGGGAITGAGAPNYDPRSSPVLFPGDVNVVDGGGDVDSVNQIV
jgi:hypothetical protein